MFVVCCTLLKCSRTTKSQKRNPAFKSLRSGHCLNFGFLCLCLFKNGNLKTLKLSCMSSFPVRCMRVSFHHAEFVGDMLRKHCQLCLRFPSLSYLNCPTGFAVQAPTISLECNRICQAVGNPIGRPFCLQGPSQLDHGGFNRVSSRMHCKSFK